MSHLATDDAGYRTGAHGIVMKTFKGHESAPYIRDSLEIGKRGGLWDRIHLCLQPWKGKMYIAPHKTGLGLYLKFQSDPPGDHLVNDIRMQIHFRHKKSKQSRQTSVRERRRESQHRRVMK